MKKLLYIGLVTVLLAAAARAGSSDDGEPPASFESREEATRYVAGLFAGGRIDEVVLGADRYFVLFRHGSGIPVIGFAQVYREDTGRWRRICQASVPRFEFCTATALDGAVVAIGKESGRKTLLYVPKKG